MKNLTGLYKHQRDHTRGGKRGGGKVRPASWDTFTAQGAENLGRNNPDMANPYAEGTTDWERFNHGQRIAAPHQ